MANKNSVYQYIPGSAYSGWRAQINISYTDGDTCVIDIPSYIDGRVTFPCASGNDHTLTSTERTKANKILSEAIRMCEATPVRLYNDRVKLEAVIAANKHQFSDYKDCLEWALSEVILSYEALSVLYTDPTYYEPFLGRHLNDRQKPTR